MIQRHDPEGWSDRRRILSFPAVRLCEEISPETLIGSLIAHARRICGYQSKFFATQRRNTREMIRRVGILLEFFEDVQERRSVLSGTSVLSLSELHVAFQKIGFLLEDCSREGLRLWTLMKSPIMAGQFQALIRSISTALDVLPLDSIDAGCEVMELVGLVVKQARREVGFELDRGDESAVREFRLILQYFEKGIEPNQGFIRQVLDYLEIKSWTDCHKEIKFLEEESGYDEREFGLLSSLIGFMSYCRGVIFETSDYRNYLDHTQVRQDTETFSCFDPEDFRCPISLELMTDPVTVSTGQTYDRYSIQKWLKAGNLICPKTGEKLTSTDLVPNNSLRKLSQQFCNKNGISSAKSGRRSRDIAATISPGSPASSGAVQSLSRFLARRLVFGSNEQKQKAGYEVRLLSKSNIFYRQCLIEAGVVPPLLNLSSSADPTTQVDAASALLKLSKHAGGRKVIVKCGGLMSVVSVLKKGLSPEAKQAAAATIFHLSIVNGYQKRMGEMPETIPALVELIREGKPCGKKNAIIAIFGLLMYPGNHKRVLEAGTVPVLMNTIHSSCSSGLTDNAELVVDSLAVLSSLAENGDGTSAILKAPALLPLMIGLLRSLPSSVGKEYTVSILLSLCVNGGKEVTAALARDPSLTTLLYSLLNDDTSGASNTSKKARSLIRILLNVRND